MEEIVCIVLPKQSSSVWIQGDEQVCQAIIIAQVRWMSCIVRPSLPTVDAVG